MADLIYGWGNEYWSAHNEYLADCIRHALTSRGPVLECGSRLSTILVGAIANQRGRSHWAFEHMPEWGTKAQRYLNRYKLDSVVVCTKPLKDYGDFCWYDPPLESMPDSFSLIICDGPPGDTKGGRYGLIAIIRERLKPGCVILLDDVYREEEHAIARRWEAELGTSFEIIESVKPYAKLMISPHSAPAESRG